MRIIYFRAKRKSDSEWIYGDLVHGENEDRIFIVKRIGKFRKPEEVIPDTVCEFTGGYDITKEPIFEGDIIFDLYSKKRVTKPEVIKFKNGQFVGVKRRAANRKHMIIGNIFDDKDLLES